MPSLCSSRTTSTPPGCSRGTTKLLIAARPRLLSTVAHTTMWVAREPAVTKIFSPLMTYSSPSRVAVVLTAAESEPKLGSVMAIAAHTLPNRSSCSSVATAAIAEFPQTLVGGDGQHETEVAPACFDHVERRLHVAAVDHRALFARLRLLLLAATAVGTRAGLAGLRETVVEAGQGVEFDRVIVFAQIVFARDGSEDLRRRLMCLVDGDVQLLREFEIDAHVSFLGSQAV